jgi:hypothetical protein
MLLVIVVAAASAEDRRVVVPVNVSFVPFYGLSPSVTVVNNVQLNIGVGYADELDGVAVGVVSIIGDSVNGAQLNVVNLAGGSVTGAQIGVVNLTAGSVSGPQVGVVNGTMGDVRGPQIGVVNTSLGGVQGPQIGVVNTSLAGVHGPQTGVVNVSRQSVLQTGVVNATVDASGVQLGVVNVAVRNTGAPIGVVSIVLHGGQTHVQSWVDETGLVSVGLVHGSQRTYNIYTVSTDVALENIALGLGLGAHFAGEHSFTRVEVMGSSFHEAGALFGPTTGAARFGLRGYVGYQVGPVAVIGGVSFNYLMDLSEDGLDLDPLHGYEFDFSTDRHRFWPGAFIGVQL